MKYTLKIKRRTVTNATALSPVESLPIFVVVCKSEDLGYYKSFWSGMSGHVFTTFEQEIFQELKSRESGIKLETGK